MIKHQEIYFSNFSTNELFDLVCDVKKYPEFLPWCAAARILEQSKSEMKAELAISFTAFKERYVSQISMAPPSGNNKKCGIEVVAVEGPFKRLVNKWQFEYDEESKKTKVTFDIEFEFKSIFLQKMMGAMFEKALVKMLTSFEERAKVIYKNIG